MPVSLLIALEAPLSQLGQPQVRGETMSQNHGQSKPLGGMSAVATKKERPVTRLCLTHSMTTTLLVCAWHRREEPFAGSTG